MATSLVCHCLQEIWDQCEQDAVGLNGDLQVVAQLGWAAALQGMPDLAERCASKAAASQDMGPRAWADTIRLQQQLSQCQAARCFNHVIHSFKSRAAFAMKHKHSWW